MEIKKGAGPPPGCITDGTKAVSTRLTEDQITQLKRAAKDDYRTVAGYLNLLISRHLETLT